MNKQSKYEEGDYVYITSLCPEEYLRYVGRLCPKCGGELVKFDGGDQGGVAFIHCRNCNYEER